MLENWNWKFYILIVQHFCISLTDCGLGSTVFKSSWTFPTWNACNWRLFTWSMIKAAPASIPENNKHWNVYFLRMSICVTRNGLGAVVHRNNQNLAIADFQNVRILPFIRQIWVSIPGEDHFVVHKSLRSVGWAFAFEALRMNVLSFTATSGNISSK